MALIKLGANAYKSGSIIQVKRKYVADPGGHIETTSTSLAASGITQSITPTATGNIIIVDFSSSMGDQTGSGNNGLGRMYIKIGSGSYAQMSGADQYHLGYMYNNNNRYGPFCFGGSYTTTSTDTLTFQPYIATSAGSFRLVHDNTSYHLTLTEIAQ